MKILFLANRVPYPPFRGDKLKIYNLAKRLYKRHELYLLTFAQTEEDLQYKKDLEPYFKEVHFVYQPKWKSAVECLKGLYRPEPFQVLYFNSSEMQAALTELTQRVKFDAAHVQHLRMSPYMKDMNGLPRILDLPDAFSLYWERRKNVKRGFLSAIFENMEQRRVLKYEPILSKYNLGLVCSSEDLTYLQQQHRLTNLKLLPNGVDTTTFKAKNHDYSGCSRILFTGNMDYAPNVDAVVYFVQDVLPIIKKQFSDVKFIIAGQRPVPRVLDLKCDYVEVTGFVEDLASMYDSADVVVAPLRFGAGTQNKVLEAMAMGIPVVCSNIGFAGLGISSGDGAFLASDKETFAQSVIALLESEALRRSTGTTGYDIIHSRFDWDAVSEKLERYLMDIAG